MNRHIKLLDAFYGNKCNLACSNCDSRSDELDFEGPSIESIRESIILANEKFDVENWSMIGGEPFLYKDKILEIIKCIRSFEPNKTIFVSTNGMLLHKNIDWIIDLIKEYRVWVQVCNHTSLFYPKEDMVNAVHSIGKKLGLDETIPAYLWWYDVFKLETGTENWKEYARQKGWTTDIFTRDPNDITYMKKNWGIHYMESPYFQTIVDKVGGIPKPFNSNPDDAYKNSCPSQFCAFLHDKKIYKCGALGTLKRLLEKYNLTDNPDWQKYLAYKPVDLENSTEEELDHFSATHYCSVSECSMCPGEYRGVEKNEINVLKIYRDKRNL
jgi:hypothetical protein